MMSDIKPEILSDNSDTTINSQQVETLKKHFPQCFDKDGNFMPEKLNEIISTNGTSFSKESYGLNWLGKSYARLLANENPLTLLAEDKNHNQKPENQNSENLLIKGDNLEVLKHLKGAYSESIKMIYIDPPYNTGSDGFVYQDDRKFTPEQLSELAGIEQEEAKRILEFTQSKANSHSAWLTFMYPRLYIARELLRDDGVIFISIDENEADQLKLLSNEIFGEYNCVAEITREAIKGGSKSNLIRVSHDYVLIYAKNIEQLEFSGHQKDPIELNLSDEKGAYAKGRELNKWGAGSRREDSPSMWFPIEGPNGEEVYPIRNDGSEGRWRKGRKKMHKLVEDKDVIFEKRDDGTYIVYEKIRDDSPKVKQFTSIFKDAYQNSKGTKRLKDLFKMEKSIFDYSKPVELVYDFLIMADVTEDDVVLDFFAGSGTTADAVLNFNFSEDEGIRFLCVQIDECVKDNSIAEQKGYKTVFEITKARIEKAAEKIRAENPDYSGDLGFKIFETLPIFEGYLDNIEQLEGEQGQLFDGSTLSEEELEHLLTTWKVYDGTPLTQPLSETDLAGYTAYRHDKLLYLMHQGFRTESLNAFLSKLDSTEGDDKTFDVEKLVLFGYNFDSKHQLEINDAVRQYQNRKEKTVSFVVRY